MSSQQDTLYEAESRALARLSLPSLLPGRGPRKRGTQVERAQELVDTWRDLPWWHEKFPRVVHVQVVLRTEDRDGSCGGLDGWVSGDWVDPLERPQLAVVEMAPRHMNALYLAHEVCHPLCQSRYNNGTHSPWFARSYLELVYLTLGSDAYATLREEFERAGVDHRVDE